MAPARTALQGLSSRELSALLQVAQAEKRRTDSRLVAHASRVPPGNEDASRHMLQVVHFGGQAMAFEGLVADLQNALREQESQDNG